MKQLLILSGKGGTGKTTTAAAFIAFAGAKAFADCDVDAPNLHLLQAFSSEPETMAYYGGQKAVIDESRCISCGACKLHCRFDVIRHNEEHYYIDPIICEGCGVCSVVCSAHAVTLVDDVAGEQALYRDERVFSTAKLKMGRGNSGKLVTAVKQALVEESAANLAIIDGSPGIGCPVIASISGVDMVLIVAEPTLSGINDMQRVLKTCQGFGTKAAVCVNKYDISLENSEAIDKFCTKNQVPFLGGVPYDSAVPAAINAGVSIAEIECPAKTALETIFDKTMQLLYKE